MRWRFLRSFGPAMVAVLFAVALTVGLSPVQAHAAGSPYSTADPWELWQYDGGALDTGGAPLACAAAGINSVTDNQQNLWEPSPEAAAQDAVAAYGGTLYGVYDESSSYPSFAAAYEVDIVNSPCLDSYGFSPGTPVFATDVVFPTGGPPLGTVCPDDSYVPAGQQCPGTGGGGTGGGQSPPSCSAQSPGDCAAITGTTPASPVVGQPITVNVGVTAGQGGSGTPTGQVVVSDGTRSCTAQLSAGTGSCQLTETAAGTYSLTASYGGDANFNASTSAPASVTVAGAPTTTTITKTAPDTPVTGQPVTATVTVSPGQGGSGTPTGQVVVSDGTRSCTAQLSGGTGSCELTETAAGTYSLTATYGGDAGFASSTSAAAGVTVAPDTTKTDITSVTPAKPATGQLFTVTATVSADKPGSGTPTGQVVVSDGTQSCTAQLSGGAGSCQLSEPEALAYTLTAAYGGDANFSTSTSHDKSVTVAKAATVTGLGVSATSIAYGSETNEAIDVAVAAQYGGTPTGEVQVTVDGGQVCYLQLIGGEAVCAFGASELPPGTYTVKAVYPGDANFKSSKSPSVSLAVHETTATAISLSAGAATYGKEQKEKISVTVSPQVSSTVTGKVAITASGRPVCDITLSKGNGSCTLSSDDLPAGTYSLIASYAGTTVFDQSVSAPAALTVAP
jgi:hypothetical protein